MSPFGHDCNSCGTEAHPCQSIAQAVHQVNWGGQIFLNGSGTEDRPYNCSNLGEHPGIFITKSLTIKGFVSPHVTCVDGFYFLKINDEQQMEFELSGIVFWQTPLTFDDCHHVKVVNCSFRDVSKALTIQIRNIATFKLDIQEFSFFHNNSQCLEVILLDNLRNRSRIVTVNMTNTHFARNGFYGGERTHRGGLKIASNEQYLTKVVPTQINLFCTNVKYANNRGPFIDLFVPNAITNEDYRNVELKYNRIMVYSLYFLTARQASVKFVGLKCIDNPSVRCIRVLSTEADIEIHESFFYKQSVMKGTGASLFLEANAGASLKISNSTFIENDAGAGGSLFADSPRGFLQINLTNVIFRNCRARKYGCTIAVGKPSRRNRRKHHNESKPDELYFTLKNVTVERWDGKGSRCTAIHLLLKSGKVTIDESRFIKKLRTSVDGALLVTTLGGKTNVTISNCSFIDNGETKRQGIAFKIVAFNGNAGIVTVINSLIISRGKKQKALFISPKYRIKLINTTVMFFRYGFQVLSSPPKNSSFPVDIYVDNCTFMNNVYDVLLTLLDPTSVYVTIKNTIFTSNETTQKSYAIRLNIAPLKNITSSNAVIELDNDTFDSKPSSNFALFFQGEKNVTIRRSKFCNCTYAYPDVQKFYSPENKSGGYFYETATGAISILTNPDKPREMGCLQSNTINDTHPLWHYNSHVVFEDTVFEGNVGLIAGGVYISNGFTKFKRCTFQDNFGIQQTGHVYSAYGTGQVDFEDCLFMRTKESMPVFNSSNYNKTTFLYSEGWGPLKIKNTSMISLVPERNGYPMLDISSGGYVDIDDKSEVQCSEGSRLLFENATHTVYTENNNMSCRINVTVLKYSCRPCSPGYYSLQKGISRGFSVNTTVECLPCPFGATCIRRNIAAKPNFWGFRRSSQQPSLKFITCPEHYCQSPVSDSKDYNSCHGNRNGTLCGKCADGFTETLFSAECSKTTKCSHYCLWIATILLTMGLVLYLLIKPPVLTLLRNQILWYRCRENQIGDDSGQSDDRDHSDSGYLKITFYFYQVVELLIDGSTESRLQKIPFAYFVISAFNFQVRTINNGIGCPFAGLTAVTKEMLLSGTVFLTMADVIIIYFLHYIINTSRQKEKPKLVHYIAVFIEVLLLGYERLAETSLKLMHCVAIGSGKWLFMDGNIPCFQWWQYILLVYIAVFVFPFIIVLYCGSSKLYKSSITAKEFLAACMLPLPFLIYWLFKGMRKRGGSDSTSALEDSKDVLDILHGPFRAPNNSDKGTLYWESVLIGRRLILLVCHTFVTNAILRVVCMTFACFLMTLHHILKMPFRDPLANNAETLSLAALTLIAAINLPKATLLSFGIEMDIDGPNRYYLETLEWIEVGALVFMPALVSLLVTFALLSQLARFGIFLVKSIRRWWPCRAAHWLTDENRPLLGIGELSDAES